MKKQLTKKQLLAKKHIRQRIAKWLRESDFNKCPFRFGGAPNYAKCEYCIILFKSEPSKLNIGEHCPCDVFGPYKTISLAKEFLK